MTVTVKTGPWLPGPNEKAPYDDGAFFLELAGLESPPSYYPGRWMTAQAEWLWIDSKFSTLTETPLSPG